MEGFSGGAIYGAEISLYRKYVCFASTPLPPFKKRRNEFFAPPKIHLFPFSIKAVAKLLDKLLSNFVGRLTVSISLRSFLFVASLAGTMRFTRLHNRPSWWIISRRLRYDIVLNYSSARRKSTVVEELGSFVGLIIGIIQASLESWFRCKFTISST